MDTLDCEIRITTEVSSEGKMSAFGSKQAFEGAIESVCTSDDRHRYELLGDWAINSYVCQYLTDLYKFKGDAESMSLLKAYNVSNALFSKVMLETSLFEDFSKYLSPDQMYTCRRILFHGKSVHETNMNFLANLFERLVGWLVVFGYEGSVKNFLDTFLLGHLSVVAKKPLRSVLENWAAQNGKKLVISTREYIDSKIVRVIVDGVEVSNASDLISKRRAVAKAVSLAVERLNISKN
uniref:Ribonuclease III n=1 Tax=Sweet potato chlorotic stunt virus TaxID=81931 RepID=M0QTD3_9CLOS|nr:ribonuclease III [Sweet potato chlorotic stunt virus]